MRKKIIGAVLLVVLIATAGFFVVSKQNPSATPSGDTKGLTTVSGIIGSEKKAFFEDQRVKDAFAKNGFAVNVETAGSREIATSTDISKYNFAFPSSGPAAQKIADKVKTSTTFSPFYSPMAIATYKPVIELLAKNGVAYQSDQGIWHIKMDEYLKMVENGTKWNSLKEAQSLYNSPRSILISSTDIRKSNSAAMYLAMASYVANGGEVVIGPGQEAKVVPAVSKLFLAQGFSEASSDDPFQNYLSQGMGAVPLVMIYESQFVGEANKETNRITDQMVLAYPEPTVYSKHIMIPLTDDARKVGELLYTNPELIQLEAEYGFRTSNINVFMDVTKKSNVAVQKDIINIADSPSYDVLESMINAVSAQYTTQGK
jgi:hypothetical protein